MLNSNNVTNHFEILCLIASQKRFCWKLFCTTCGNAEIRYGFLQIAKAIKPNSIDWNIRKYNYKEFNISSWSEEMVTTFLNELSQSSIKFISENCNFPDWLGYLGIIFYMFHFDFKKRELLTKSWKLQLDNLVKKKNPENLESVKDISLLSWENLELYEKALSRSF